MKKTKQSGQEGRKAKGQKQERPRACAGETVVIPITDEQGKEQVRVSFSRREYAELKAMCGHLDCSMQQLFILALTTELAKREAARTPTPADPPGGGNAQTAEKLKAMEDPIYISAGLVHLLGNGLAGALTGDHPVDSTLALAGGGVDTFAQALAEDVQRSWEQAHDAAIEGRNERETCEQLGLHLREAAAFTHAACHALARNVATNGDPLWREIGEAYTSLAARAFRFLDVYHKEVPVHPYRPEPLAVVKPEVAA